MDHKEPLADPAIDAVYLFLPDPLHTHGSSDPWRRENISYVKNHWPFLSKKPRAFWKRPHDIPTST